MVETTATTARLRDGRELPRVGFGTFRLAPGGPTRALVRTALEAGYRHIDTATVYGNEADVGAALRDVGLDRDEVWVTTKLWNGAHGDPRRALEESLRLLGLEQVDLWLMHWPVPQRLRSWETMLALRDAGLARSVGVSNFLVPHLQELLASTGEAPAVDQVELSPFLYGTRRDTVEACRAAGIVVEAYSPLTKGARLSDATVGRIAAQTGRTPAQVMLGWGVRRGFVVLPRSSDPGRIASNLQVFDVPLSEDHMAALDDLDEGLTTGWDPSGAA